MNELTRTLSFVATAAVVGLAALLIRPSSAPVEPGSLVGELLFPQFSDPAEITGLEIVKFDEALSKLTNFRVAKEKDRWLIPSHSNYPADATKQLAEAAGGLVDIRPIAVMSSEAKDHAYFGVVEPSEKDLKVGSEGVGTLVVMQKNETVEGKSKMVDVMRLIIGKEAASDTQQGASKQYFIRVPGQDPVYVAALSIEKLTTDFDAWIEKDLLRLNALDVSQLTLKDYAVLPSRRGQFEYLEQMQATIDWSNEEGKWSLGKLLLSSRQGSFEAGLAENEELNNAKLDELKTALDDLKIEDVVRKPAGLGANLRVSADKFSDEGIEALAALGFLPVPAENDQVEIFASNGEAWVEMKDGVQYVLRFGNIQGAQKGSEDGKLNRYLMVTARVSPSLVPPTAAPAAIPAAPPTAPDVTPPAGAQGGGADPASEAKPTDEKPADVKPAAEAPATSPPATTPPATTPPAAEAAPATPAAPAAPEMTPEEKELQRKIDEYTVKRKKAEQAVAELNLRFADWFYVISEDTFKKIHLSRADIIKESATAQDEGFGIDAFRKLEREGIEPPPPAPPAGAGGQFPGIPNFGN